MAVHTPLVPVAAGTVGAACRSVRGSGNRSGRRSLGEVGEAKGGRGFVSIHWNERRRRLRSTAPQHGMLEPLQKPWTGGRWSTPGFFSRGSWGWDWEPGVE